MQDMSAKALGDVPVRPDLELRCHACGAGDIRTYVYDLAERDLCVRLICIGCGAIREASGRWVRSGGLSAGVHAGLAEAPKGKERQWWGIPETLTPPDPPKRGRGRPRNPDSAKPWIAAGISKTTWYSRKKKAKAKR